MHVLALGNEKTIDHSAYDKSLEDLRRFLRYSSRRRVPALLCLTEDWKNHPAEQWEEFAKSGAAGFEIVNASPKGLDFPDELKRAAVETGRRRGLLLIGGSDNHGWGSAAYVWNVMRVPGYQAMPEAVLRSVVLETLKKDPADAVEVVTRVKADPLPGAWNWLDPPRGLWVLLSALTWAQTFVSLAWVWALSLGARKMHALF